ncbi:RNA editing 3' terminal uridylyl transferase [Perkinsela sp. CCAP 1560/4]|nr:RNA editing 3' terminal uridylyl transferase [Perkinsela sp. CCAP 1560/4]|eukprot:KNH06476.1 RNA editing 3' terminal uridylyl transferase [Perkinsela sp. CCAP 1560/4]
MPPKTKGRSKDRKKVEILPADPMEECTLVSGPASLSKLAEVIYARQAKLCVPDETAPPIDIESDSIGSVSCDEFDELQDQLVEKLSISVSHGPRLKHVITYAEWWQVNKKSHQLPASMRSVCDYVYHDEWPAQPSHSWDRLLHSHNQLNLVLEYLQCSAQNESLSSVLRNYSYRTYIFGGTLSFGFWDGESDVDFCCISEDRMTDPENSQHKLASHLVKIFFSGLRKLGWQKGGLLQIPRAKVPILMHHRGKFGKSYFTGCTVDVPAHSAAESVVEKLKKILPHPTVSEKSYQIRVKARANTPDQVLSYMKKISAIDPQVRARAHFFIPPELSTIDFDLSFHGDGIRNSWLIRKYLSAHALARHGALYIKRWAKARGINNGKKGYLCSYAFVIMWIYFLVFGEKLIPFIDPESIPMLPMECKNLSQLHIPLPKIDKKQTLLGELILHFFYYYTTQFDWAKDVVSLCRENGTTRAEIGWNMTLSRRSTYHYMCIEDPYKDDLNLARNLTEGRASETIRRLNEWISSVLFRVKSTETVHLRR